MAVLKTGRLRMGRWMAIGIYVLSGFFLFGIGFLSNVYTMGYYTPLPRLIAITVVNLILLVLLCMTKRKVGYFLAVVLVCHLLMVGFLWMQWMRNHAEWMRFNP